MEFNKRRISKIKILVTPRHTVYFSSFTPNTFGLTCGVFDENDEFIDFYADPWIEYPELKIPGVYKAKVYLDKEHTDNIFDTFKYKIREYDKRKI